MFGIPSLLQNPMVEVVPPLMNGMACSIKEYILPQFIASFREIAF